MSIPYGTAWDNTIAVALPYGARTMQGAAAGSIGVCIPFVIFMCVMFQFMYAEHFAKQVSHSFPKCLSSTARVFVNIMLPFSGKRAVRAASRLQHAQEQQRLARTVLPPPAPPRPQERTSGSKSHTTRFPSVPPSVAL